MATTGDLKDLIDHEVLRPVITIYPRRGQALAYFEDFIDLC